MKPDELQLRTKQFAIRVLRLSNALPRTASGRAITNQLVRAGTSIGANYRAARRARSKREFVAKLGIVVEEADETVYWLDLIIEAGLIKESLIRPLLEEAEALMKIFSSSRRTAGIGLRKQTAK